jgi:hypothetical protein
LRRTPAVPAAFAGSMRSPREAPQQEHNRPMNRRGTGDTAKTSAFRNARQLVAVRPCTRRRNPSLGHYHPALPGHGGSRHRRHCGDPRRPCAP